MRKLIAILFIGFLFIGITTSAFAQDGKTSKQNLGFLYTHLLLVDNVKAMTTGTKSIYRDEIFDTETLDVVAEVLHDSYSDPEKRARRVDLISWLAKTLGKSGNMRYKPAVEKLTTSDNRKIQKYATRSLPLFAGRFVEPFKPEPSRLEKLKQHYQLTPENKTNKEELFFSLNPGDALASIIDKLGMPNSIGSENSKSIRFGRTAYRARFSGMVLNYDGLGAFYLNYQMRNQAGWKIDIVSNIYYLTKDETDNRAIVIADYILGDNWLEATQVIAKGRDKTKQYSERIYDIAAEKLYRAMGTHNRDEIKMLTHLASFIRTSAGPRYMDILQQVSEESESRHIRRHAGKAYKTLKKRSKKMGVEVEQYIAGSLDIGKYTYR